MEVSFSLSGAKPNGFQLKSVLTDEQGHFRLEEATPDVGDYFVQANVPGLMAERIKLRLPGPQTLQLRPGYRLAGRVVEADTGYPIPAMEIRALNFETRGLPMLSTVTDEEGRFSFASLANATYHLHADGGQLDGGPQFPADGRTNLTLSVKLYQWSKLKPKPPASE
jgi:hypothetical protein